MVPRGRQERLPRLIVVPGCVGNGVGEARNKGSFPPFWGAIFPHFVSADISTYRKKYHARDQTVIRGEFSCPVRITTFSDIEKSADIR